MQIKVKNTIPGIKVLVNQTEDGVFNIDITKECMQKLGDIFPGKEVTIGKRKYIVLEHKDDGTALITKDFAKSMEFGSTGDYEQSEVRKYCNTEFYNELVNAVGKENIIPHLVDLEADDGTGKGNGCKDMVSVLTTSRYRQYREFLPAYGKWWWLSTRVSATIKDYSRNVCCVNSDGTLYWDDCVGSGGVRPFCTLKPSIFVDS